MMRADQLLVDRRLAATRSQAQQVTAIASVQNMYNLSVRQSEPLLDVASYAEILRSACGQLSVERVREVRDQDADHGGVPLLE